MKLTKEQTDILTNESVYECSLTKQRFSLALFDVPSPLGNVICFESPIKIGALQIKNALTLCVELPSTNIFGGVCFQRLYLAQIGSILSNVKRVQFYVDQNCLFVEGKQASLTIVNTIKDTSMIHIIFPKVVDVADFWALELTKDEQQEFEQHCINCFEQLTNSIFLETRRDNI